MKEMVQNYVNFYIKCGAKVIEKNSTFLSFIFQCHSCVNKNGFLESIKMAFYEFINLKQSNLIFLLKLSLSQENYM